MGRFSTISFALAAAAFAAGGCSTTAPGSILDWDLTPDRVEVTPGSAVSFHVKVKSKVDINSDLELMVSGPDGFALNLTAALASTADETDGEIMVPAVIDPGTYQIEVSIREEGSEAWSTKDVLLIVGGGEGEPDFTVELDPTEYTMEQGVGKTFTYYIRPLHGFQGTVEITRSPVGDDLAVAQELSKTAISFATSGGDGGTFVLRYEPNPPVASPVEVVITVAGGGIVHTRTLTLTLPTVSAPSLRAR